MLSWVSSFGRRYVIVSARSNSGGRPLTLLVLVSQEQGHEAVEAARADLEGALADRGLQVRLVDSIEWYEQQFPISGTWESWIWDTVNGRDCRTRTPHFDGFLVLSDQLGRANATVAAMALRNGSAVLGWHNKVLQRVRHVESEGQVRMQALR